MHLESLQDEQKIRMLLKDSAFFMRQNMEKMLKNARLAMETAASLRELGLGARILQKVGVLPKEVENLLAYEENVSRYKNAGYPTNVASLAMAVSDINMWELFNILTAFATHNRLWSPHDIRRTVVMNQSMELLNRRRDIREPYNIYR